jgi:Spy/CpxP family protein refolding chaperone
MKNIRSAIAAGLLVFGGAVTAAAQATPAAPHAHAQRGGERGAKGPGPRAAGALFRGIKLSDAEKTNLKAVRAKYAPQYKVLREQFKPAGKIARGDTAAMKARREQMKPLRDQTEKLMQSERAELRAALTQENQAKFDANVQKLESRLANRANRPNGKRAGRGLRAGK